MDESLILEALGRPTPAIAYSVSQELARRFPERHVLEGDEVSFDVGTFAVAGHCTLAPRAGAHSQILTTWHRGRAASSAGNGWFEVVWDGHHLDVIRMSWQQGFCSTNYYWIVAQSREVATGFFSAVCAWCSEVRGEVLVFAGGQWRKDAELYAAIQGATFDNLILAGSLKEQIRTDVDAFFASRELYAQYGIPWKRGVLFVGPPGNGKTHAVKALINSVRQPCLYVKSFKGRYSTDHDNIRTVFRRARESTPCVLVFEDLDSLIDAGNRAFFLNELDGFETNTGIVTIATTNHPERLDASILDRPSRFDRKYHFDLPGAHERLTYLSFWNERLQPDMRQSSTQLRDVAELADSFSFAYLKELVLSSMVRWIGQPAPGGMHETMTTQATHLREQMGTMHEVVPLVAGGEDEDEDEMPGVPGG